MNSFAVVCFACWKLSLGSCLHSGMLTARTSLPSSLSIADVKGTQDFTLTWHHRPRHRLLALRVGDLLPPSRHGRPEQPRPSTVGASGSAPSDALLLPSPLPSLVLAQPRSSEALAPDEASSCPQPCPSCVRRTMEMLPAHSFHLYHLSQRNLKPTHQARPLPCLWHLPRLECGEGKKASAQIDISTPARSFESDRL